MPGKHKMIKTTRAPGMIPIRYSGVHHAFKVIFFEEGIQGLYRGFGIYSLLILGRLSILKYLLSPDEINE